MGEKIAEKSDFYDIIGIIVPGILIISWMYICFPKILSISEVKFSDTFALVVLIALSVFIGYMVQALASLIEPLLCCLWRGKYSNRVFDGEHNPCLRPGVAARIRGKLSTRPGMVSEDDAALYQYAAALAENAAGSRVARFNSQYAFHRALLVLVILVVLTLPFSGPHGLTAGWNAKTWCVVSLSQLTLLALVFNRTRERSVYYVREVVLTAERLIDVPVVPPTPASDLHAA